MNTRIEEATSRLKEILKEELGQNLPSPSSVNFQERHAEQLLAAGFGFPSHHDFLAAAKAGSERCIGYYIPDSAMIKSRMAGLGYPPEVVLKCVSFFSRAVSNGDGTVRADLIDVLHGERKFFRGSEEAPSHRLLLQYLDWDLRREESSVWAALEALGIAHDDSTDNNLTFNFYFLPDFPSPRYLVQTIDSSFDVCIDLDQGEDEEAVVKNTDRRLVLRGNIRLKPSGKRGWGHSTIRLLETPVVDNRTTEERRGEYPVYQRPDIDKQEFVNGTRAGRGDLLPSPQASFDFLAGWIMTANEVNSTGHMSIGQIDKAFYGALKNANTLRVLSRHEAFDLASEACRYSNGPRFRRALEELIRQASAD